MSLQSQFKPMRTGTYIAPYALDNNLHLLHFPMDEILFLFNFFSKCLRFWYQKMSHIFLITRKKFNGQKVFPWEDSSENVTRSGYHN